MLLERVNDRNLRGSLKQLQELQEQFNQLLSLENSYNNDHQFPPLNVWSSEEGIIIEAEIPGANLSDIEITVVSDSLTLKGKRTKEELQSAEAYHKQERPYGTFARTIELPFKIEADKVKAEYNRGILEITLPRAEADKPKKISVKATD